MKLREVIVYILERRPGATDRQLTEAIFGDLNRRPEINQACRSCSMIERRNGPNGIGNYLRQAVRPPVLSLVQ